MTKPNATIRATLLTLLAAAIFTPTLMREAAAEQPATKPLEVGVEQAFAKLEFDRPIVLTHAGDGTNRVFVASQRGKIHVFPNDQAVAGTEVYLDIEPKVVYKDSENEEGLLGMAFHPNYRENGELFIYYTTQSAPHTSVISRFRVSPNDPNLATSDSEEEIFRLEQPFWNHNGGTIAFGPDGYLYVGLGDGGAARDPHGNGQNLGTLLGSILRIDVDRREAGQAYAVPPDNPFADRAGARGEIWAYGLRNVWRMAFDRETGALWAGDVGQDLWEEIDIIRRGGNYGWNRREGKHPFGENGAEAGPEFVEPVWEYHHDVGKSITGGVVYRGASAPELTGMYLYADYVTGQLYALDYDVEQAQVRANYALPGNIMPVLSYGEDEQGEAYFLTQAGGFGRVHRFTSPRE